MATIKSGATADLLTIDPTSKAARVTQYDSTGRELYPAPTGSYVVKIECRHTTTAAAGVTLWNMRGPPTLKAYIRNIRGVIGFDGTAATGVAGTAAATQRFGLYRGAGAASATGGTALTNTAGISKKDSSMGTPTAADIRYDISGVGLTTTSITYETEPFHVFALPVISLQIAAPTTSGSVGAIAPFDIDFHVPGEPSSDFVIAADQHIAIRLVTSAAIIGFGVYGSLTWDER